jgi:hypothetical protein
VGAKALELSRIVLGPGGQYSRISSSRTRNLLDERRAPMSVRTKGPTRHLRATRRFGSDSGRSLASSRTYRHGLLPGHPRLRNGSPGRSWAVARRTFTRSRGAGARSSLHCCQRLPALGQAGRSTGARGLYHRSHDQAGTVSHARIKHFPWVVLSVHRDRRRPARSVLRRGLLPGARGRARQRNKPRGWALGVAAGRARR